MNPAPPVTMIMGSSPEIEIVTVTGEKWLRRVSKIFFADPILLCRHDTYQSVNVISAKAENI